MAGLLEYLEGFHDRTQPLSSYDKAYAKLADFDDQWAAGGVVGWEDHGLGRGGGGAAEAATIDLQAFESVEELETLGTACFLILTLGWAQLPSISDKCLSTSLTRGPWC